MSRYTLEESVDFEDDMEEIQEDIKKAVDCLNIWTEKIPELSDVMVSLMTADDTITQILEGDRWLSGTAT